MSDTGRVASSLASRLRFNVAQAADYCTRHPDTIRKAAQSGELHGTKPPTGKRARWNFRRECLDAWCDGELCPHQQTALPAPIPLSKTG